MPEEVIRMAGVKERMAVLKQNSVKSSMGARPTMRLAATSGIKAGSFRTRKHRRGSQEGNSGSGSGDLPGDNHGFGVPRRSASSDHSTMEGSGVSRRGSNGGGSKDGFGVPVRSKSSDGVGDDGFGAPLVRRNSTEFKSIQRENSLRNMHRRNSQDGGSSVVSGSSDDASSATGFKAPRRMSSNYNKTGSLRHMQSGSRRNVHRRNSNNSDAASAFGDPFGSHPIPRTKSSRSVVSNDSSSAANDPFGAAFGSSDAFASNDPFANSNHGDGFGAPQKPSANSSKKTNTTKPTATQVKKMDIHAPNDEDDDDDDFNESWGSLGSFGDFGKGMTTQEKEQGAQEAKAELDTILTEELGEDSKKTNSYKGTRVRYVKAVSTLRPEEYHVPNDIQDNKKQARKHLRKLRQKSAAKKQQLDKMRGAWNKYDDFTQEKKLRRKPKSKDAVIDEEEMELEQDLDEMEVEIVDDWCEFAEAIQEKKEEFAPAPGEEDDDTEEDSDMEQWMEEAQKLKHDKQSLHKRQARRKDIRRLVMERQAEVGVPKPVSVELEARAPPPGAELVSEPAVVKKRKKKKKPRSSVDGGDEEEDLNASSNSLDASGSSLLAGLSESQILEVDDVMVVLDGDANNEDEEEEETVEETVESTGSSGADGPAQLVHVPDSPTKRTRKKKKPMATSSVDKDETTPSKPTAVKSSKEQREAKEKLPLSKPSSAPVPRRPDDPYYSSGVGPFKAWMHPPKRIKEEPGRISFKCPEKTECWRKTRHNFTVDNAPFCWHKMTGDFEVLVHLKTDLGHVYDKAGLMIRVDQQNWMVTVLEYFHSKYNHSTCMTQDFTDWSICPIKDQEAVKNDGIWMCAKKIGNTYEAYHSIDGQNWIQTRQGLFHENEETVRVGLFCACPMGTSYNITFSDYNCQKIE